MKKRQRLSPLGASEFAATLNGDDPNAIHNVLGRFIQTVRQERQLAIGGSLNDEKSSESSASDEEESQIQKKQKFRKEEIWKEDTANYDVPFVGTSVAKGDVGRVVTGEWPTGLLKAYVQKSPRAVEFNHLLSGGPVHKILLRRKHGKTWHRVQKLYLQASAELVTAAIPKENIKGDNASSQSTTHKENNYLQLVESFAAIHFTGWCSLLKEETGNGKGKAAVVGGCGQLAPYVIRILHRLSRVNSDKARQIVRDTEQNISEQILRFFMKQPIKGGEDYATSPRAASKIELLEWVGWLASIPDQVLLSRLCSPGARDRKLSPGLLFMSLKEGTLDLEHDKITSAVELVIRTTRRVLLGDASQSRKLLIDIFSKDILHNFCRLSVHAPVLSSHNGFEKVLLGTDESGNHKEAVGSEARRLLFILMCDPEKSPLIQTIQRNLKSAQRVRFLLLQIIQHFLKSDGGEITKLTLKTLRVSPSLFPALLDNLSFPDVKRSFAFISRVNLAANVILHGPSVQDCMGNDFSSRRIIDDETILHFFLPLTLKDTIVKKALQSSNILVVAEVLKLIVFILKRVRLFLANYESCSEGAFDSQRMWTLMKNWLPDPSTLLSLLMKADIYHGSSAVVIASRVCIILRFLVEDVPDLFNTFTFDWSKLLSKQKSFPSARALFLLELLWTLLCMLQGNQLRLPPGTEAKFCHDLLQIVIHTKLKQVHDSARNVVLLFLSSYLNGNDRYGENNDLVYELSCWIDGLSAASLEDFCTVLQQTLLQPFNFTLQFARIWSNCFPNRVVPHVSFSPLMVQSLRSIHKVSTPFSILYTQVATNSLLYHSNPNALATAIKEVCRQEKLDGQSIYIKYLEALINELSLDEGSMGSRNFPAVCKYLQLLFSEDQHPLLLLSKKARSHQTAERERTTSLDGRQLLGWTDLAMIFGQGSNLLVSDEEDRRIIKQMKSVFPVLLLQSTSMPKEFSVYAHIDRRSILIISGLSDKGIDMNAEAIRKFWTMTKNHAILDDASVSLYQLYFLCPFLPPFVLGELLCELMEKPEHKIITDSIYCALTVEILDVLASLFCKLEHDAGLCGKVATMLIHWWLSSGSWLDISGTQALVRSLVNLLIKILLTSNLASSFALCELSRRESTEVITRCMQGELDVHQKQIMLALIEKEPTTYSPAIMEVLRLYDRSILSELGDILVAMKTSHMETDGEKEALLSWQLMFLEHSVGSIAITADVKAYNRNFENISRICESTSDLSSLISPLSNFLKAFYSSPLSRTFQGSLTDLVYVTLRICHSDSTELIEEMASITFMLLIDQVARSLRSYSRKSNAVTDKKDSRILETLESLISLLASSVDFDPRYLREDCKDALTNVVKLCLRIGLRPVERESDFVSVSCLKLVQLCVSAVDSKRLSHVVVSPDQFATLVFEMATTHSKFHDLLRDGSNEIARKELVGLLIVCLEIGENIIFRKEVWQTLLNAFDCGMSTVDLMLRKAMKLYGKLEKEAEESLSTLDQLTWGMTEETPLKPVETFLNLLEMYRVQATLCNFPLYDSVDPLVIEVQKGLIPSNDILKDDRYSPGFILPVALSHLELIMDIDETTEIDSKIHITLDAIDLAQRYCERGIAALSFMAMASDCVMLRRTGTAILGLLNFLAGSKRAMESTTWRSRPQLAMLFDSFRRAMVIFSQGKETSVSCPQLPSLSALFLARSTLILAHPGDDVYPNLNRVFLRIEKDHGAFQDLWRLPSFITLLCSAADDREKQYEERIFALRLVRDGFLSELCYKPLHACHGIELIISAFDSYKLRARHDKEDELIVLMEALERIVIFGGTKSSEHLFKRLGLMSFWRSLIMARSFTNFVHTSKARSVFLSCLKNCLNTASLVITKDDFSLATTGLWQILLKFCLESISCDISFASICVSTLQSLVHPSDRHETFLPPINRCDGVDVPTATRFLKVLTELKDPPICDTPCFLPLRSHDPVVDEGPAVVFCVHLLRLALHGKTPLDHVLLRIGSVIEWFNSPTFDKNDDLLKQLFFLRCETSLNKEVLSLWQKSVRSLVKKRPDFDESSASAFKRLTQNFFP